MSRHQLILFDLDGTLTDPKKGITYSVAYALDKMGIKKVDPETLTAFIGPPLKESFREFYDMTDCEADRAIQYYRERFKDTGIYENQLYPGIEALLKALKSKDVLLAVATSKPTVFAVEILNFFKIEHYFDVVVGSELDGTRSDKSEVIGCVLNQFKNIPVESMVMVGDRKFDVEGAKSHRIKTIGVSYGYGSVDELTRHGATIIAADVDHLKRELLT